MFGLATRGRCCSRWIWVFLAQELLRQGTRKGSNRDDGTGDGIGSTCSFLARNINKEFHQPLQKQQSSKTLPSLPPQRWGDAGVQRPSVVWFPRGSTKQRGPVPIGAQHSTDRDDFPAAISVLSSPASRGHPRAGYKRERAFATPRCCASSALQRQRVSPGAAVLARPPHCQSCFWGGSCWLYFCTPNEISVWFFLMHQSLKRRQTAAQLGGNGKFLRTRTAKLRCQCVARWAIYLLAGPLFCVCYRKQQS